MIHFSRQTGPRGRCIPVWVWLLIGLVLLSGCQSEDKTLRPLPPPVVIVSGPTIETVTDYAEFTGTTAPYEYVEIRARVEGYLQQVAFTPGSRVAQGDLLFVIDPEPFQALVNQAEAIVRVRQAEARLAETTLKRKENAYKDRAISELEVLEARAGLEKTRAAVAAAQAESETAKLNLSYTRIKAPISGRTGRNLVDTGNLVGAAGDKTLLTTMVREDPILAYFTISERELLTYLMRPAGASPEPKPVTAVQLGVHGEAGYPHKGRIDFLENRVDESTGTIQVRGVFDNPKGQLVGGLFARIRVPAGGPRKGLLVPERALGYDQQGRYALVVDPQNEVVYRSVKTGNLFNGLREIVSGIEPQDRLIIDGLQRARPGVRVDPKPADPAVFSADDTPKE
ncbi:efflux RND transporter periplasmic adaptor subunit [Desulfosarcina sp.]|uniref:efflux RND transporter periplasmic adaptor subunit n=1 Tax=Desulfosarcina sp. TaxID=2027861 RepID=UPI0039708F98